MLGRHVQIQVHFPGDGDPRDNNVCHGSGGVRNDVVALVLVLRF